MVKYYSVYITHDALGCYARLYGTAGGKGADTENYCNNAPFTIFKTITTPPKSVAQMRTWLQDNIFSGCALIGSSGSADGENTWAATKGIFVKHGKVDVGIIVNAVAAFSYPDQARKVFPILDIVRLNDFSNSKVAY